MSCEMIVLDYQGRKPIYQQIEEQIERYIALGILKEQEALPSIRELASFLGVNPNTVKKAYDRLETKKRIVTISTKGCFISKEIKKAKDDKILEIYENLKRNIEELEQYGEDKGNILKKITKLIND